MLKNKDILMLIRFGFAGIAGFVVDSIVAVIAIHVVGFGSIAAQAIAFTIAVTVTWLINRHWAFSDYIRTSLVREWSRYVAANSVGAMVNNSVYVGLVTAVKVFSNDPILAVAAGSRAGLFFNFTLSKRIVFKRSLNNYENNDISKAYTTKPEEKGTFQ